MHHRTRWTTEKIQQRIQLIEPLVYRERIELSPFEFARLEQAAPFTGSTDGLTWQTIAPYQYWEKPQVNFLLRGSFTVPAGWQEPVVLVLSLGEPHSFSHPESLIYIDGQPYGTADRHHQEVLLDARYADGQTHSLLLHGFTGYEHFQGPEARLQMKPCYVAHVDTPTRDFIVTARTALEVAVKLADEQPAKGILLNALDDAFRVLDTVEPFGASFYASVSAAHRVLRQGVEAAGAPLDVDVLAIGHAHIDVAWLWTLAQTRLKAGRTFSTALNLMNQFPDYTFTQSQPQLYDYVRQDYPHLFEQIRQRIAEGRWEAIGGMWVEADCNLSGAESLARQFLLGRSFYREHFGKDAESPVLWLPDVFGYAWALPQLIKLAGLEYFFTIKIGWNQYNRLPYDSFWWQGIDGTRVLTHFSTTPENDSTSIATYNARAVPHDPLQTWRNFQQKEHQHTLMMVYGYGDGGGGPTREMLENIRELNHFPAVPRTHHGKAGDFFRRLEDESGDVLPTWNGELYLELHRGTYTTQSRNKRANRKSEFALHDAEFLASLAAVQAGSAYPAESLREAWQLVCLNQFHDIIPGSSINDVYKDSLAQYAEIAQIAQQVKEAAIGALTQADDETITLVNPTSFPLDDVIVWEGVLPVGVTLTRADGEHVQVQRGETRTLIHAGTLPPYSLTPLKLVTGEDYHAYTGIHAEPQRIENRYLIVELNENGDIIRIYDKMRGREVLPEGQIANQLQALEDRPVRWDAWDVDIFINDRVHTPAAPISVEVIENGPLRAAIRIRRSILSSRYGQVISMDFNSPSIRFDTEMDWRERHTMLKVAFPVDILAPQATYEIQWGSVERPTHRNTSWDWARFETCAQKWVDLSENDYGVSLLNDSKYGHDIRDNVIRLSLLRSPTWPDPEADQGMHRFTYVMRPHMRDWRSGTVSAAYALNDPAFVVKGSPRLDRPYSMMAPESENVIIETIKGAEDGRGVIVRLYEAYRRRGTFTLATGFEIEAAYITNLLEDDLEAIETESHKIHLSMTPYQIINLRIIPKA